MEINGFVAFIEGILSFFAPCILPLVPSFLIYISGATINQAGDLADKKHRNKILFHSLFFIAGFSFMFISLGFSSSLLGDIFSRYETWIMRIGGLVLILMGLSMLNVVKISFLSREKMVHLNHKPAGYFGSFVVGLTFSLGWTPCIGPVLASILLIACTSGSKFSGAMLLGLYSLGLAIPFFAAALLASRLMRFMQRWGYIVNYTSKVLSVLLILLGFFLLSGYWKTITAALSD
jgi:cytochrome c-type biogenesis protein